MDPMLGQARSRTMGRKQIDPSITPKGAQLGVGNTSTLDQIPTAPAPTPKGAIVGDDAGNGHMGAWADKLHPTD
jgi:hypothetical protein